MRTRYNNDVFMEGNLEVEKDLYVQGNLYVKLKSTFMIIMIALSLIGGAVGGFVYCLFVYWLLMRGVF